ncbi:P-loop NTPase fold protein [Marinobacter sp. DY40_1A1]|uniref:P-loop NTPase fold protein n=1 Tax=Marinobacter sp. DY40_1A1 TaxID=2583229 RepID=UPI001D1131BE|nr:P-loop NTPase fold protein [Marinobacter sp. DY40_1A1]
MNALENTIATLIDQEGLPKSYANTVQQIIAPLVYYVLQLHKSAQRTLVVGIHGAQGTGKSTLALFMRELLSKHWSCPTASFSLDDIYLTRAERWELAEQVHPLLLTRGVPGTHDLELGLRVVDQLRSALPGDETAIPAFDKSIDDRAPAGDWPVFKGRPAVILLEGWCVGARAQSKEALIAPVNLLEEQEDSKGVWRDYVNQCLSTTYKNFFRQLDSLIMLKAPSMESVLEWRILQEHKLAVRIRTAVAATDKSKQLQVMSDDEIARFIMHYERITRAAHAEMPAHADVVINVSESHSLSFKVEPPIHMGYPDKSRDL